MRHLLTFRFALSQNSNVLSFWDVQEIEDGVFTHHPSEVYSVHLKQTVRITVCLYYC